MLRVLAIEPYYGGSHRAFLDGYAARSRHSVEMLTMPARKWKWRMRGAALTVAKMLDARADGFDVLFASDFLDLAALVGMRPGLAGVPRVVYFHENQITYPVQHPDERDYHFGFTNITTCLAADLVLFNSAYHRDVFVEGVRTFLRGVPDYEPRWVPERIAERSDVVPVGVDLAAIDAARDGAAARTGPLTVLWNHRWEYDKGADVFFELMMELADEGHEFELAVTGERFREAPPVIDEARERLGDHVRHFGYVETREDYCRLLVECDVAVSTAIQEFFGISMVEAACAGCAPLAPNDLSYPTLLPERCHAECLYECRDDLKARLIAWMADPAAARAIDVSADMRRFGWDRVAPLLDNVLEGAGDAHA